MIGDQDTRHTTVYCAFSCFRWESRKWIFIWWRHNKDTFSTQLTFCAGNSLVTDAFLHRGTIMLSFLVFVISLKQVWTRSRVAEERRRFKVAEDDIAFKLAILKKSLHLNDNTCLCSIIQSSKLVLGSLLAKNNFFVQFWTKIFASSRMANCGSGLPAEWPFRSQNAIETSDSPLPGGLWVKRLITHALCSLA